MKVENFKKIFIFSLVLVFFSFFSFFTNKFNFGIDFSGGLIFDISNISLKKTQEILSKTEYSNITIQSYDGGVMLKTSQNDIQDKIKYIEKIKEVLLEGEKNIIFNKIDFVGPQVGKLLIKNGIKALLFSFIVILIYVAFRFEFFFGLATIIACLHDTIILLGFISFFKLEFDLTTIAGILTIIGYSINDTIVVFDRIRENKKNMIGSNLEDIINKSINSTLKRTIYTSLSTLLSILPLLFVGVSGLRNFAKIVSFGVLIGTYSSIFIASPILLLNKKR